MTVCAKFGKNVYLPKDAEFYFIYNGSHQRHIVIAERTEDNVLQSSIPGEACVCLCVCVYSTLGYLMSEALPAVSAGPQAATT